MPKFADQEASNQQTFFYRSYRSYEVRSNTEILHANLTSGNSTSECG